MGPKQQMTQVISLLTLCPQTNRFQINLFTSSDIQNSDHPVHRLDKFSDQRIRYTDLTDLQINRLQINRLTDLSNFVVGPTDSRNIFIKFISLVGLTLSAQHVLDIIFISDFH